MCNQKMDLKSKRIFIKFLEKIRKSAVDPKAHTLWKERFWPIFTALVDLNDTYYRFDHCLNLYIFWPTKASFIKLASKRTRHHLLTLPFLSFAPKFWRSILWELLLFCSEYCEGFSEERLNFNDWEIHFLFEVY